MADINDLLGAAINSKPVDFASALNDILADKASAAIDARQVEIAQSLYSDGSEDNDVDLGLDDIDLDNLDLGLEDNTDVENNS